MLLGPQVGLSPNTAIYVGSEGMNPAAERGEDSAKRRRLWWGSGRCLATEDFQLRADRDANVRVNAGVVGVSCNPVQSL